MAAAVFDTETKSPERYFVLIQGPLRIQVREVDMNGGSWALDSACDPDVESFVEFLIPRLIDKH